LTRYKRQALYVEYRHSEEDSEIKLNSFLGIYMGPIHLGTRWFRRNWLDVLQFGFWRYQQKTNSLTNPSNGTFILSPIKALILLSAVGS